MISLGVDIGGTGAKCVAFREDGSQAALSYTEYPNPAGKTNLDPIVLSDAVLQVIAQCVKALPDASKVACITVSSFGESFVPIDEKGNPLSDIIMYFAATQSREFDALVQQVGAETFMRITRTLPDAFYSLSKMLYTRAAAPRPVWKYLLISSYLCYCLCGETVLDVSLACRTLLYDVNRLDWSDELLQASGFRRDQMPTVVPAGTIAGKLKPDLANQLELHHDVSIVIGAHDQVVNALACGVAETGDAADVSGTTESIAPLFPHIPDGFDFQRNNYACVPYLDRLGYVTYAFNISGGMVIRWFRDTLASHLTSQAKAENLSIYDLLNRLAPTEPNDLLVLPFLQGMGGTPDVLPQARGMFYGLSTQTDIPAMYRAILEGLTFEMAINLEQLARFDIRPKRLFACGGGARSRLWLSIKADIWNREVIPVLTEETGALGSAILGFAAVTGEKSHTSLAKRFVRLGEPVCPDATKAAHYAKKMQRYKRFRDFIMQEETLKGNIP
ncbi:MAG: FGGY-family carbohydrate kinase [Christensenellales bacterium]|jgi:xylulokinase